MSAFQDFGPLTERRRAERQQRRRKHLMMAGATLSVILIVAAVAVAAVLYRTKGPGDPDSSSSSSSSPSAGKQELRSSSKVIEVLCSATDFKTECQQSLTKAINKQSPSPKDLIKSSVSVITDAVTKAFGSIDQFKSDDPKVKSAVEVCKVLFNDTKDELEATLGRIDAYSMDQLSKKSYELRNWLSAVVSYQETCIDAFPEGDLKTKMQETMKTGKQLTSNALAIISKASSFLKELEIPSAHRRLLLAAEDHEETQVEDGLPWWVSESDRRHLKERAADRLKPNAVVAQDGSGQFNTINAALAAMPKKYSGRYIIYVKAGVYDEHVEVTKQMANITMFGDGSQKTIVTGNRNFVDGYQTFNTATFVALGPNFICEAMGFRNTAGPEKHQAVALRVQSDRSIFINCRMEGFQDTLYAQTHFQFYRSCVISGTVDFIFGDASAVFQNCVLALRRPMDNQQNIVTAQGRSMRTESTGFVIHNCRIIPEASLTSSDKAKIRSYLGRPWKEYARTVIMETEIDGVINPEGYMPWEANKNTDTSYYAEYNNRGPGADAKGRVKWPGVRQIKKDEAVRFTPSAFLAADDWIKTTGTPIRMGLYQ